MDSRFCFGEAEPSVCEQIYKRMRSAANQAGLQVTQGHHLAGLELVQLIPELVALYRSPKFMDALERTLSATMLPNPNLDLGIQAFLFSTKKWLDRGRGWGGYTVWLFCNDVPVSEDGAFVIYNRNGVEACRIQPRLGAWIAGDFGEIEHEVVCPRTHAVAARLTYCDARKVAHQTVWGAASPEARRVLSRK